jgi:hypothetical protein
MSRVRVLIVVGALSALVAPNLLVNAGQSTHLVAQSEPVPFVVEPEEEPTPPPTSAVVTTTAVATTTTPAPVKVVRRVVQPAGDGKKNTNKPDTRPKPAAARVPLGTPFVGKYDGPDIEGYARYEAQSTCDPAPKPGTVALRDLLLSRYPNTSSLGIGRSCETDGVSEHEEGRAFDWGANVNNAAQRAAVDDFITALFATDKYGHPHALARRMGVMYVIWNHQIWGAYQADAGWRPYDGANPHTDHMHISMSWAGARSETSFWSGHVVPGLPDGTRPTRPPRPSTTSTTRPPRPPRTTTTTRPRTTTTTTRRPTSTSTTRRPTSTTSTSTSTTTTRPGGR